MGRRRRRAVKVTKAKPKLDTQFNCPYCGNQKSVEVRMNRPESLGMLKCRVCGVAYQTRVHYMDEPVDVYAEWIDTAAENQAIIDARKKEAEMGAMSREKGNIMDQESGRAGPSSGGAGPSSAAVSGNSYHMRQSQKQAAGASSKNLNDNNVDLDDNLDRERVSERLLDGSHADEAPPQSQQVGEEDEDRGFYTDNDDEDLFG